MQFVRVFEIQLVRRKVFKILLTLSGNSGSFPHENILDHVGNEGIFDTSDIDDTESFGDKSSETSFKYPSMNPTVRLFKKLTINFEASAYCNITYFSHWKSFSPVLSQSSNDFI